MKAIKLECKTAGFSFGEVVTVGNAKGDISPKDAKALVESGMAKEYDSPVVTKAGPADKTEIDKLEKEVEALEKDVKNVTAERDEALKALEVANTELTMLKAGQDGKDSKAK